MNISHQKIITNSILNIGLLNFKRRLFHDHYWLEQFASQKPLLQGQAYLIIKRMIGLTLVLLSLPLTIPIFILCAILIKLEDPHGPVLFIQRRTGKGGKRFAMYKFRTMVYNAEALKQTYAHLNELQWPDFKITDDPRVTKIGRILRKTSLDELPQLLNVIKGDMYLVGPRPTSFRADTYDLWQTERLDVTPGITGLWQIMGRGTMEFTDRVYLDVFYIEHRCVWLDMQILVRTVVAVLARRGVH